jgi:hypothetical protein
MANILCGCFVDQKRQVATCCDEARRVYPDGDFFNPLGRPQAAVVACMARYGYEFDISHSKCVTGVGFSIQPYCYKPTDWLERLTFWFESM